MTSDMQDLGYCLNTLLQPLPKELAAQLENSSRLVDNYIKVLFQLHISAGPTKTLLMQSAVYALKEKALPNVEKEQEC